MVVDIGLYLLAHQQASVKEIKEHTNILKAASILQKIMINILKECLEEYIN